MGGTANSVDATDDIGEFWLGQSIWPRESGGGILDDSYHMLNVGERFHCVRVQGVVKAQDCFAGQGDTIFVEMQTSQDHVVVIWGFRVF